MKKQLLFSITKKDFEIDYFSGTGAGGQYRNRHKNCVGIHHKDSGAIVTGQSHRERKSNIKEAFDGLLKNTKFKMWHAMMVQQHLTGKTIEEIVEETMIPENLKIEGKENGKWEEIK